MSKHRRKNGTNFVVLAIAILMIAYGGYMTYVDATFIPPDSVPEGSTPVPEPVEEVSPISAPEVSIPVSEPVKEVPPIVKPIDGIYPLPDIRMGAANLFGGDGTINLANIILFVGIFLAFIALMMGRR